MDLTYIIIGFNSKDANILKSILMDFADCVCLGINSDYSSSLENILKQKPELVFLNMDTFNTFGSPFQFILEVEQYLTIPPNYIAVSNSTIHAYEVIKSNFCDYILNPFSEFEIRKCLMRYKKQMDNKILKKICLKSYTDYRFIDLEEILYLKADNNTTDFHMIDHESIVAYKTLKHYESILPECFIRIHNSYLINSAHITRINFAKSLISLNGNSNQIPFSRSYKSEVETLKSSLFQAQSFVA